jgi:hypothetical protein
VLERAKLRKITEVKSSALFTHNSRQGIVQGTPNLRQLQEKQLQ